MNVDLKKIYSDLHALQVRAFGDKWKFEEDGTLTIDSIDLSMQKYALFIIVEAVEMLLETNWREHKAKREIDLAKLREELIDVVIYAMDAGTVLFPSYEAFLAQIQEKKEYNERRTDWSIDRTNLLSTILANHEQ